MLSLLPDRPWAQPPRANNVESGETTTAATSNENKKTGRKGNKRNSDIRKEQNKIASRTYRQKRKEKLALLQQLLEGSGLEAEGTESTSAAAISSQEIQSQTPATAVASGIPATTSEGIAGDSTLDPSSQDLSLPQFQSQSFEDLLLDDAWPNLSLAQGQEAGLFGGRSFVIRDSVSSLVDDALEDSSFQLCDYSLTKPPVPSQPEMYSTNPYTAMDEQGSELFSNLPTAPAPFTDTAIIEESDLLPSSLVARGEDTNRLNPETYDSLPSPILKAVDCFAALDPMKKQRVLSLLTQPARSDSEGGQHHHRTKSNSAACDDSTQRLGTLGRLLDRLSGMAMPDVKTNTLHIMQNGFFAAILENALAIGLTQNHELLEEDALSPFGVGGAQANPLMIAQARLKHSNAPKDLQPLDRQILIEHHPYIDVIPFPSFRERILQVLTCDPPVFDEEELCHDLRRDGIIVWGSQGNSMGMGACTPWDMRSWEPQLWFLKKYWFLVGGWDDELWRAARWWHTMRNEKLDLSQTFTHV